MYDDHPDNQLPIAISDLPWQIKLFLLSLILPAEISFSLGSFHLTGYRLILLFLFLPCLVSIFSEKHGKRIMTDWFFLGYGVWIILSISLHHGIVKGLESGGILFVESFSAYLLARTYIRNKREFSSFVKHLIIIAFLLSLITIPEALTGTNIIRSSANHSGARLGLTRAFGPFDHSILYGVFCASIVSLSLYVPTKNFSKSKLYWLRTTWITIAAFMSVSSGALFCIIIQISLAIWEKVTRSVLNRWKILTFLLLIGYFTLDLLSNRTPIRVILHRLTFNAATAYNRITIWEWGTKYNVAEHPLLGIGFSDWVRPEWMNKTSIDNFWLVNMVRYGLPSFFLLAAGILYMMVAVQKNKQVDDTSAAMRTGWIFSIISLIMAGCTVHFWNSLYVWFFFLIGSISWILHEKDNVSTNDDQT